jgi:hypothetical protein
MANPMPELQKPIGDVPKLKHGRKFKGESRSTEFRQTLIEWRQIPAAARLSLRALARQLGTSHQLLQHYLDGLEEWEWQERRRKAKEESEEIRARAKAEGREMTRWECVRTVVDPALLDTLMEIRRDAQHGPLHRTQFQILRLLVKQGFPGAQEVLQECSQVGLKKRKRFAEIVKDTPRQKGESSGAWVRRIWDECDKYETNCPEVLTIEFLEKCSRGSAKNQTENLPQILSPDAKSFRSGNGDTGNSAKAEGRRSDALV